MFIVTGGAGFIGANLVYALNQRGISDILVSDHLQRPDKFRNLADLDIRDYYEAEAFLPALLAGRFGKIDAILHQGACSDTMASDGRYVMENNFAYTKALFHWCQEQRVPFLYASSASVYGMTGSFHEERSAEDPLNIYAFSKFQFDQYLRAHWGQLQAPVHGFRFFNVYGPREFHKGRMASVALHFSRQYRQEGQVRLFAGSDSYADGEQQRDFIHVDDVVAVNLHFLDRPQSGIYNVGTGRAQSFNEVATAVIQAIDEEAGRPARSLAELQKTGVIQYMPMPEALHGKYQSFTQADIRRLRAAGYDKPFLDVAAGVRRYLRWLRDKE
ncbi:ADP-glyceromanno-heptose 6-epimerase [Candidatus Igneacidithiobacillus taiwanensis]|uniref:ADP-glyceromanno-heptose 6-epimerase n=1 Tax=Candidatus Igneacidithiobacillus taiwanensis TaxID=1945924 RepID=UPI0028A19FE9|nr:ADP-glyceromanno-heptose 6-epimerase [Candidatus Igneacidithiobacillus taiwanensis]MCE5361009.1 ADP-glyceromanno-heptose 6-epimerase [Acidithiobacillus sp.]